MTQKDILLMVQDEEIMGMLKEMNNMIGNLSSKTKYEKKSALKELKAMATEVQNKMIINKVFA